MSDAPDIDSEAQQVYPPSDASAREKAAFIREFQAIAASVLDGVTAARLLHVPDWRRKVRVAVEKAIHDVIEDVDPARACGRTVELEGWSPDQPSRLSELLGAIGPRQKSLTAEQADANAPRSAAQTTVRPVAEGELSAEAFGQLASGVSRQTVDRWRKDNRVIALPRTGHGYRYPKEQLDEHRQLPPGLDRVIAKGGNGHTTWLWLTAPHARLGRTTPLAALREGYVKHVLDLWEAHLDGAFE